MGQIERNLDAYAATMFDRNINLMVPYYLMAAYAYYKEDDPIFSDAFFDDMAKTMLARWEDIEHYHKVYISKNDLKAGTYLGAYPERVKGGLRSLRQETASRSKSRG